MLQHVLRVKMVWYVVVSVYGVASRQCVREYQSRINLILVTFSYPSLATILLEYYIISFLLHLLRVLMTSNAKCENNSHPCHFLVSLTRNYITRMLQKICAQKPHESTGTGSGVGTSITEMIRDDYEDATIVNAAIFPYVVSLIHVIRTPTTLDHTGTTLAKSSFRTITLF